MLMSEYLQKFNKLKELLKNHAISNSSESFKIYDLQFIFNRDEEGFYEENSITIVDYFSKRTLTLYCIDDSINGVYLMPFMEIGGCGALVPNIVGKIDLADTFKKLEEYINQRRNHITLFYDTVKKSYVGDSNDTKDIVLNFDVSNPEDLKQLQACPIKFEFNDNIFIEHNGNDYEFVVGDVINIPDFNLNEDSLSEDDYISIPTILIEFTTHDDIRSKINEFNQQKAQRNENNSHI